MKRRIAYDAELRGIVENYRKDLSSRFEEEVNHRNDFNEKVMKYLPAMLNELLEKNPINYEVFPKETEVPVEMVKFTEEVFRDTSHEDALAKDSSNDEPESSYRIRTTTC